MNTGDLGVWATLFASIAAAGAWLTGETGKIMVAGGLGGLVRALTSEQRKLRDGVLAAIGGGVTGVYLWPLGLHLPAIFGKAPFPETPSNVAMSAFLLGSMGTSTVKIIAAFLEARAAKLTKGGGDAEG